MVDLYPADKTTHSSHKDIKMLARICHVIVYNSISRLHCCGLVQGIVTQTLMKQSCYSTLINISKREFFCHSSFEVITLLLKEAGL